GNAEFKIWWTISHGVCPPSIDSAVVLGTDFVTPSVTLSVNSLEICEGEALAFEAVGSNGGSKPVYEFYALNGSVSTVLQAEDVSNKFTILNPVSDTTIYVRLRSNSECLSSDLDSDLAFDTLTILVDRKPSS